jgi:hypothetical protein
MMLLILMITRASCKMQIERKPRRAKLEKEKSDTYVVSIKSA